MQDLGNSGRGGSTASFNVSQQGFSTPGFNQVELGVSAPLGVSAAPNGATRLAAALGQFQQKTEQSFGRMAMEQSQADTKAGMASGAGYKKNDDGTYGFDYSSVEGKSKAFVEGAVRGAALKSANDAQLAWQQAYAQSPDLQNASSTDLAQKYDQFMQQRLGGMQNSPVAKEEIAPMLQHWHDQMAGQQLHKELVEHQQEQIDGAMAKVRVMAEAGQVDSEGLIKNNLLPAFGGNMRQAQLAMIDTYGRVAVETGNPALLDQVKAQSGSHFGDAANDSFDKLYKSAQAVQKANQKDANEKAFGAEAQKWEGLWSQDRPVPKRWLSDAQNNGLITPQQFLEYSRRNDEVSKKQENTVNMDQFILGAGGYAAAAHTPMKADKDGVVRYPTGAELEGALSGDYDRRFGWSGTPQSMTTRLLGDGKSPGALANLMDTDRVGMIDPKSKEYLTHGLDLSTKDGVQSAQQIVNWIDQGHGAVVGQLGITPSRMAELRGAAALANAQQDPSAIAEMNRNTDPQQRAARLRDGAKDLENALNANTNPQVADRSWSQWMGGEQTGNGMLQGNYNVSSLTPDSASQRQEYVRDVAKQMYSTGNMTPAQAAKAANNYVIGMSTFYKDPSGKYVWQLRNTNNVYSGPQISDGIQALHDDLPKLIDGDTSGYSIHAMPGGGFYVSNALGIPATMKNGQPAYFSTEKVVGIAKDLKANKNQAEADYKREGQQIFLSGFSGDSNL